MDPPDYITFLGSRPHPHPTPARLELLPAAVVAKADGNRKLFHGWGPRGRCDAWSSITPETCVSPTVSKAWDNPQCLSR